VARELKKEIISETRQLVFDLKVGKKELRKCTFGAKL
jgi:hypothetical protein